MKEQRFGKDGVTVWKGANSWVENSWIDEWIIVNRLEEVDGNSYRDFARLQLQLVTLC